MSKTSTKTRPHADPKHPPEHNGTLLSQPYDDAPASAPSAGLPLSAGFVTCCRKEDFKGYDGPGTLLSTKVTAMTTYSGLIDGLLKDWTSVEHPWPMPHRPSVDDINAALTSMVPKGQRGFRTYECRNAPVTELADEMHYAYVAVVVNASGAGTVH